MDHLRAVPSGAPDEVAPAVGRLCCIVQAERARRARMGPVAASIIETFRG